MYESASIAWNRTCACTLLGVVPAYRTSDYTMVESAAIIMQVLDEHLASALAPAPGSPQRAEYYQWCVFGPAELDPALSDVMAHTMHPPDEARVAEIATRGQERFATRAQMLSTALAKRDYLLGANFSGADITIGYCCNWAAYTSLIGDFPVLVDYYARLQARPAFQQVFA